MSRRSRSGARAGQWRRALTFAALGDGTRLWLIGKLTGGEARSISRLAHGSRLTRQAITKHLRILERAGIVRSVRAGRESLFALNREAIVGAREYLDFVSKQWDQALDRLKRYIED